MITIPEATFTLYNGEVELTFDDDKHLYTVDGEPVPSITGILKVINKPALMFWSVSMATDFLGRQWAPGRSYDEVEIFNLLKDAKAAHRMKADDAATIGTMTHAWIERHLKGEELELPENPQMRGGVEAFLKFQKEHNLEVTESERKVYSKKYNVAGTCDIYGTYEGEPVVADIKTSSAIYPEALLQTAGYDLCLSEELDIEFKKHLVINCGKDGSLNFHISDRVEEGRKGFIAALELHRALQGVTADLKEGRRK